MVALSSKEKKLIPSIYNQEVPQGQRTAMAYMVFRQYALDNPESFRDLLQLYGTRKEIHGMAETKP
jgi:hypothetical protein